MAGLTTDILSLIPQRPPFVMIDSILHYDEAFTRSEFRIMPGNILVENGRLSEAGLVENIAQTAAARAGLIASTTGQPVQVGYIGSLKNLRVYDLPKLDDVLETEIRVENQIFDVTVVKAKVWCNNLLLAECEMKIFIGQSK